MLRRLSLWMVCVLLLGSAWSVSAASDPTLVGWWWFDEGTGTVAHDSSGYGNDGTLMNGPTWVAGYFGKALQFDGTNDYVEVPHDPILCVTTGVTVMAWVNTPRYEFPGGGYQGIISKGNAPRSYSLYTTAAGLMHFSVGASGAYIGSTSTGTVPQNEWAHVCAMVRDGSHYYFVNGTAAGTGGANSVLPGTTSTATVLIGDTPETSREFGGMMDDVRIYNRGMMADEILKIMTGSDLVSGAASEPSPADGATDVPQDIALSWAAGEFAATHDVYFGTTFADVNDASRTNPGSVLASQGQTNAAYDPDGLLEFGRTYYWRVDEVNAAPDNTIFNGPTWSFTVEPFSYPITTAITATASSSQPGMGPQNTVNGSGLNADDQHSTTETQMWMSAGVQPNWIQFEFDKAYKLDKMLVWNSNQLIEAFLGFGAKSVTIEYSTDGTTWTALEGVPEFARAPGAPTYTANTTVDLGGATAKFVKLTIHTNWGGITPQTSLSEVRFFSIPVQAFNPEPATGAADVSVETELDWRPGREATSHKVFLGTDQAAVVDGTAAAETVTNHGYSPAGLLLGTQYFWKVDEIGGEGPYAGAVWSFTTEAYAVVEDFESYNDDDNRIYEAWIDGLTDSASGSQVGYNEAPFAEQTIVHGGSQSMPLVYDNSSFAFSEATLTFATAQDWTARGIKSLSVHFAGAAGNGGKLYVKINSTKIAYDGDAADLARPGWQAWNIDLSKAGNVKSVKSLTIGVEGSGAKGTLYLDDIRLSPKAPEFTTPVEPPVANLIARYAFDGNVNDSSGKGKNGTANGGPNYVAGVDGQALQLDGTDDFVAVGSVGISGPAPRTISGWAKADTTTITDWTNLFGFTSSPTGIAGQSFDMNKRGGANQYCIHAYGWERNIMAIDLEWHHLAATYDGTTVAWYGDGQLVGSEAWVLATQDNVQMGKRAHAAGGNFPGSLDEVRIYDKALSAEEIAWLAGRRLPVHKPL